MIWIAVDAMGGDGAPRLVVDGAHDLVEAERRQRHFRPLAEQYLARPEQLAFLEAVGGHDQHMGLADRRHLCLLNCRSSGTATPLLLYGSTNDGGRQKDAAS